VGANTSTISGGTLEGAAGQDLIVNQFNTAGQLTIGSTIADNTTATALTKSGGGTLLLNSANTFTGGTRINAGTLMMGNDAALGGPSAGLALATGGTLDLNGHNLSIGPLSGNGGTITSSAASTSTITVGDATSPTFGGIIQNGSGTLALVKTGAGTLTLGGANTYTGGTTVAQGFLQGGTGGLQGNISITSPTAGVIFNGGGTYAGTISGTGGVSKIGGGALIFSNVNGSQTYSGPTTLGGGTLTLGTANGLNVASSLTFSGGTLATGGLNQAFGTIGLLSTSTVDLGAAAATTPVSFADSHSVPWTVGATLKFANWTGLAAGGGTDEVMVGAGGLSASQLSSVKFDNFKTGAKILGSGELVPLSTTPLVAGDIDQNGQVNGADVQAMLGALTDLNAYKAAKGLSDLDVLDVADVNRNGGVSNSDLQTLLGLLISQSGGGSGAGSGSAGGGAAAVPEPAGLTLGVVGAIAMLSLLLRRRWVFAVDRLR
jgi:fibronectin-binding autotransporter adhesin